MRVRAAETVKVATEERDPTYWQMNDKIDILYGREDVSHAA